MQSCITILGGTEAWSCCICSWLLWFARLFYRQLLQEWASGKLTTDVEPGSHSPQVTLSRWGKKTSLKVVAHSPAPCLSCLSNEAPGTAMAVLSWIQIKALSQGSFEELEQWKKALRIKLFGNHFSQMTRAALMKAFHYLGNNWALDVHLVKVVELDWFRLFFWRIVRNTSLRSVGKT